MLFSMIIKDLKLLLHDRIELFVLLLMPLAFIGILGAALGGGGNANVTSEPMQIALVDVQGVEEAIIEYEQDLAKRGFDDASIEELLEQARTQTIPATLRDDVFSGELESMVVLEELSSLSDVNKNGQYEGVFLLEEGYHQAYWDYLYFQSGSMEPLQVKVDENEYTAKIITQMVDYFFEQWHVNMEIAVINDTTQEPVLELNETYKSETTVANRLISGFDYYAVGMVTMFVMFGTTFVASYALTEKKSHLFLRLRLANIPFYYYMLSKWLTSFIIAFLQVCLIFTFCYFVYEVTWDHIGLMLVVTSCLSAMIGGLSTVLASLSYISNSYRTIQAFSFLGVAMLSFIGGSFGYAQTPITKFTPNGVAMEGYFIAMVGNGGIHELTHIFPMVLTFVFVCLAVSSLLLTRKGDIQ